MKKQSLTSAAAVSVFGLVLTMGVPALGQSAPSANAPGDLEYSLALKSIEGKRIEESLCYLDNAIGVNPKHAGALARRCWVRNELGEAAALADCEAALTLDRSNADALRFEGDIYFDGKDYARAKEKYEAALKIRPADADTLASLSMLYDSVGDLQTALGYATLAIRADPAHDYALVGRGNLYRKLNELPKALQDLDVVVARSPQLCIALKMRYLVKRDMGQAEAGREDLRKGNDCQDESDQQRQAASAKNACRATRRFSK